MTYVTTYGQIKQIESIVNVRHSENEVYHGDPFGQNFASSGCRRCLLQDEDHSGSRPHSFPDFY